MVNGLNVRGSSDLDISIIVPPKTDPHKLLMNFKSVLAKYNPEIDVYEKGRKYPRRRFKYFENQFPRLDRSGWIFTMEDRKTDISIDIMVNKVTEVLNSNLLLQYSMMDSRFRKLAIYLKFWNKSLENGSDGDGAKITK